MRGKEGGRGNKSILAFVCAKEREREREREREEEREKNNRPYVRA